ncbi:TPA: DUF3560 domain-containing protein [Serratia marcescens]
MNTYYKFAPNVFLAKCPARHEKGDVIEVTTRHAAINESIIFNLIFEKEGYFYYSVVRADGFNCQERAKAKSEKYSTWASSAKNNSDKYYEASNEGKEFLSLAEPIKVGHHSERRHRALIERNWKRMEKSVAFSQKAAEHDSKSEYWASKENDINISLPESIEFFKRKLEKAKDYHAGLKSGKYERQHSYALTYAKKEVNTTQKLYDLAIRLWG